MPPTDFVSRGQALIASGQYQEAVKICRLGLLAKPTDLAGRLILGQALLALRRYDEVLAEMRVAIDGDARNAGAHQLRGEAFLRKGDAFAAVESLERARELAHGDPTIAALLAEARHAVAVDASRTTGDGATEADGDTKHYPTHRGGDASGQGRSGSFTKPLQVARGAGTGGRRTTERSSSPSLDHLDVGDNSGTVEVDPDHEGVEVDDDELGELIDPPSNGGSVSIIVDDSDLLEVEEEVSRPGPARRAPASPSLSSSASASPSPSASLSPSASPSREPERAPVAERAPAPVVPLFGTSTDPTRGARPRPGAPLAAALGRPGQASSPA
ncbi:MAG TPA: hypothetical protein VHE35_05135, partial [Kofleriaceae bacterium]|nr:hypothetical protein [Kofleriaceae bacterium]